MSLSSQYLEELSKRYKKQVEEMQRLLDKTLVTLNEESKKRDERNKQLEERLNTLALAVENLISEKNSWKSFTIWVIIVSISTFCVFTFCRRTYTRLKQSSDDRTETAEVQRRKSIDVVSHTNVMKRKRRPSDQALKIVRSAMLANDDDYERRPSKERKKKKKKHYLKRSNSMTMLNEETSPISEVHFQSIASTSLGQESAASFTNSWVEGARIEELPIVLDESEHSTLEELPVETDVDAPIYMRTALDFRLHRLASHNGSMHTNGDTLKNNVKRKSASLDETSRRKSPAPSLNGGASTSSTEGSRTPKKEKKSFKKLFKKVF